MIETLPTVEFMNSIANLGTNFFKQSRIDLKLSFPVEPYYPQYQDKFTKDLYTRSEKKNKKQTNKWDYGNCLDVKTKTLEQRWKKAKQKGLWWKTDISPEATNMVKDFSKLSIEHEYF